MSPMNQTIDTVHTEAAASQDFYISDMRRVSLSLAFSPSRHRRRKTMNARASWLKNTLGINWRRAAHS